MFVGKQLLKGLEDLKKQYQEIYNIAFDTNLTEQERLAKIQQKLVDAAKPTSGDSLIEKAKAEAIRRQKETQLASETVVELKSEEA